MLAAVFQRQVQETEGSEAQQMLSNVLNAVLPTTSHETDHKANWVACVSLLWPKAPQEVIGDYAPSVYKDLGDRLIEHIRTRFEKDGVDAALGAAGDYLACCVIAEAEDFTKCSTTVFDDSEAAVSLGAAAVKELLDTNSEDTSDSRYGGVQFKAKQLRVLTSNSPEA